MVVNTQADEITANSTLSLREAINLAQGTLSSGALTAAERAQREDERKETRFQHARTGPTAAATLIA